MNSKSQQLKNNNVSPVTYRQIYKQRIKKPFIKITGLLNKSHSGVFQGITLFV